MTRVSLSIPILMAFVKPAAVQGWDTKEQGSAEFDYHWRLEEN